MCRFALKTLTTELVKVSYAEFYENLTPVSFADTGLKTDERTWYLHSTVFLNFEYLTPKQRTSRSYLNFFPYSASRCRESTPTQRRCVSEGLTVYALLRKRT